MNHYTFASCRGPDFEIDGENPQEAWEKLVEREKDNGTIWRASDPYMVQALIKEGWKQLLSIGGSGVAYKEITMTFHLEE